MLEPGGARVPGGLHSLLLRPVDGKGLDSSWAPAPSRLSGALRLEWLRRLPSYARGSLCCLGCIGRDDLAQNVAPAGVAADSHRLRRDERRRCPSERARLEGQHLVGPTQRLAERRKLSTPLPRALD